jgi:UPF0755 protein
MQRLRSKFVVAAAVLLAIAGLGWMLSPAPAGAPAAIVHIRSGTGRWAIARRLAAAGAVRSAAGFELWCLLHPSQSLQAGVYRFPPGQPLSRVFDALARGHVYTISVTVPEGYNRFDIARELADLGLAGERAFLAATANPAAIRDLDPAAVSLEGYLFPATYPISPHTPIARIIAMMVARFRQEAHEDGIAPNAIHAWVTVASMIEKETAVPAERPLIAGVFDNRLRLGLPLQCDPTVIYAAILAHRYTGAIHRSDLTFSSPYNTYLHAGLPPGPIANPGHAALMAAAHPARTSYLYFVSNGHGGHRFARTLAGQQRNLRRYLRTLHGGRGSATYCLRRPPIGRAVAALRSPATDARRRSGRLRVAAIR